MRVHKTRYDNTIHATMRQDHTNMLKQVKPKRVMTRQDKIRINKTRPDKTRKRHNKTGQDTTARQEKTRTDKSRSDAKTHDKIGKDKVRHHKIRHNQRRRDKTGSQVHQAQTCPANLKTPQKNQTFFFWARSLDWVASWIKVNDVKLTFWISSSCSPQHMKLRIQLESMLIPLETCNRVGAQVFTETPWREREGMHKGRGSREGTTRRVCFQEGLLLIL